MFRCLRQPRRIWKKRLKLVYDLLKIISLLFLVLTVTFLVVMQQISESQPKPILPNDVEVKHVQNSLKSQYHINLLNSEVVRHFNGSYITPKDQWIRANPHMKSPKLLLYSAYWDDRTFQPSVRVIGVTVTKKSPSVYCKVFVEGKSYFTTAKSKPISEHWNLLYSAFIFTCDLPKGTPPAWGVILSFESDSQTTTNSGFLLVHRNKEDKTSKRGQLAVCVKPLHYNYNRAVWLLEFLELHRTLGVEHFIFYNHSMGKDVKLALEHYLSTGLVTILPWNLDVQSQKEIRTEGLFASLNDCLYRTMHLFEYVIMLDFDEFIIPRESSSYAALISKIETKYSSSKTPSSFVFKNTFFYLYWENDTSSMGAIPEQSPHHIPYLLTQYKTRRMTATYKYGSRSKYIVLPHRALEVGNHFVWRVIPGTFRINVPESLAILHHYRICEFGGYECLKKPSIIDRSAHKFGTSVRSRVEDQCRLIYEGGACPLSPPLGSPW